MFILKLAGKILLLPVWLILFVIGLAVKMTVQTYAVVRGILGFIFTLLIIATACCAEVRMNNDKWCFFRKKRRKP